MKEINVLSWCDECDTNGERTQAVDSIAIALDGRPTVTLDMCEPHAKALRSIGDLIDSHGARVEAKPTAPNASKNAKKYPCPLCDQTFTARSGVLNHLTSSAHGVERVEASRMTAPTHDAVVCGACGFISQAGVGVNVHFQNQHPGVEATFTPYDPTAPAPTPRRRARKTAPAADQ
jgi:hypothetical protein